MKLLLVVLGIVVILVCLGIRSSRRRKKYRQENPDCTDWCGKGTYTDAIGRQN